VSVPDALSQAWGGACPYEALYFRAHTYGPARWPMYTTGLAVLVNTRAVEVTAHNADAPQAITHHVAQLRGLKQSRICAHVRVTPRGGTEPLHVFNTHLSLPSVFAKEFWDESAKMGLGPNQLAEARSLARFVRDGAGDEPLVVMGDFNAAPATPVYRELVDAHGWESAQAAAGIINPLRRDGFATAGFLRLRMHLDHVFGANGVRFLDMRDTAHFDDRGSPFYGLSDHAPQLATLAIPASSAHR
jgi:endonuclease/exonuclease/phosphatase family metal-dependent hydrolase